MKKCILGLLCLVVITALSVTVGILYLSSHSNPHNYKTIAEVPAPKGFTRVEAAPNSFAAYLRNLPLKGANHKVQLYTGGEANYQIMNYAVVDMPLLNNWEQCADVCIRLRTEYLYGKGQYDKITYKDVNGKTLKYGGGRSRASLESFLKKTYGMASTYSLSRYLPRREELNFLQPGDIFVYPARKGAKYGHAVMVADVAKNEKTGEIAFMVVEGNTPARSIHLMRNFKHPFSPWFYIDDDEKVIRISPFKYYYDEIRYF